MPRSCRNGPLLSRACRLALGRKGERVGELNLVFTTNRGIRSLHRDFLSDDSPTDVIAFGYASVGPQPEPKPFGDVFVSVDQARIQARDLGHSLLAEILTLAIHGTLHLVGYDDHAAHDRKRMFSRQDKILRDGILRGALSRLHK